MTEAEQRIREAIAWGDAPGARIDPADAAALLADRDEREAALRAEVEALKADLSTYMQAANEHLADAEALRKLQAGEAYKAADYLRAQADAQPVAPVALVRAYNAGYMAGHHDTAEGGFVDIHPSDMDTYHADVVAELGLPAAPQDEPMTDSDYWLRNRQAILDAIERAGFVLMSNASGFWLHPRGTTEAQIKARDALLDFISENGTASEGVQYYLDRYVRAALAQVEQERQPLSDEQIDEEATIRQMTAACEDAFYDGVRWAESAHRIGGSDAE